MSAASGALFGLMVAGRPLLTDAQCTCVGDGRWQAALEADPRDTTIAAGSVAVHVPERVGLYLTGSAPLPSGQVLALYASLCDGDGAPCCRFLAAGCVSYACPSTVARLPVVSLSRQLPTMCVSLSGEQRRGLLGGVVLGIAVVPEAQYQRERAEVLELERATTADAERLAALVAQDFEAFVSQQVQPCGAVGPQRIASCVSSAGAGGLGYNGYDSGGGYFEGGPSGGEEQQGEDVLVFPARWLDQWRERLLNKLHKDPALSDFLR